MTESYNGMLELLSTSHGFFQMKNFRRYAVALSVFGGSLASFAEGTAPTLETLTTSATTSLTALLTSAGTAVAGLVTAGLAIWGGIAVIGVLKRAFSAGKGR